MAALSQLSAAVAGALTATGNLPVNTHGHPKSRWGCILVGGGAIALSWAAISIEILVLALRALSFYILKNISRAIDSIDQQLDKLIADIPQWQERVNQLTSVKAVGKVLAFPWLSELPELDHLNR